MGMTELTQADFEGQAYEVVKAFYPDSVHLQFQMEECHKMLTDQVDWANPEGDQVKIDVSKPLPLSGLPGHALSISKMKVARYLVFGLEQLVSEHMWINEIMRFNEIYKFSDGMLTNIMEALDYRVKEYKVNRLNL
nr:hypothetical protein [Tanacetum cinerariifolium]